MKMSLSKRFFLLGSILLMAALFFTFNPKAPSAHAASVSASASTTTAASQTTGPQVTCYGGKVLYGPFSLKANTIYLWPGSAPWFRTSGRCLDINVNFTELTASMQMQVCFENIPKPYCNSWKTVSHTGTWYQIATNVLAGTDFRFGLKTTSALTYEVYGAW
jgi:hypothetical protein